MSAGTRLLSTRRAMGWWGSLPVGGALRPDLSGDKPPPSAPGGKLTHHRRWAIPHPGTAAPPATTPASPAATAPYPVFPNVKTRLILNPRSGPAGRQGSRRDTIARTLAALSLDADVVETRGPGDASALARAALAEGCTRVVAVGGDGTVNEIARVLAGTDATLVIVPSGSGNGLARHLRLPLRPQPALALLRPGAGVVHAIDTAMANEHFFCNAMGLGFDAEIAARFSRCKGRGLAGYVRTAWQAWCERVPLTCGIESREASWTQPVLLLTIANSDQYGNDVRIAPGASVRDGRLDLVAVLPVNLAGATTLFARLLLGRLESDRRVHRVASAAFRIRRPGPGILHTDGEVRETGPVIDVRVQPQNLRVLVPAGAP